MNIFLSFKILLRRFDPHTIYKHTSPNLGGWFLVLCVPVPLSCSRTQETIDQTPYEHSLPKTLRASQKRNCKFKMRFNFDLSEQSTDSRLSLTPKEEVEWVPLQKHPVFSAPDAVRNGGGKFNGAPKNLVAWDGASRLYYWDQNAQCLHRISVRLGEPEPTSILAASPSKVLSFYIYSFSNYFFLHVLKMIICLFINLNLNFR